MLDSSDYNTDNLRLRRCRRTSPRWRCGRLPNLIGPSGCGTFFLQRGSLQRCRARSPTETPADHWETDREQTHCLSNWPFLQVTIKKKQAPISPSLWDVWNLVTNTRMNLSNFLNSVRWSDDQLIFTWSCQHEHRARARAYCMLENITRSLLCTWEVLGYANVSIQSDF